MSFHGINVLLNDMVSDKSTLGLNGCNVGDTLRLMALLFSA